MNHELVVKRTLFKNARILFEAVLEKVWLGRFWLGLNGLA